MISASKEESEIVDNPSMKRQEFNPRGFKRIFEINEKIDKENITAAYQEGVLKITLPKLAGTKTYRKDIDIV
jgi:HSP20 family protein